MKHGLDERGITGLACVHRPPHDITERGIVSRTGGGSGSAGVRRARDDFW